MILKRKSKNKRFKRAKSQRGSADHCLLQSYRRYETVNYTGQQNKNKLCELGVLHKVFNILFNAVHESKV